MTRYGTLAACVFALFSVLLAQHSTAVPAVSAQAGVRDHPPTHVFENPYLKIDVLPGWTTSRVISQDPLENLAAVRLTKGKYVVEINPLFEHASGIVGGRFDEVIGGRPSVEAVMERVDKPAGGFECGHWEQSKINSFILASFYTDFAKKNGPSGEACNFPSNGQSV